MNQEAAGESATPLAWVSAVAPFKKFQTEFANVVGNLERIKGGKCLFSSHSNFYVTTF